MSLDTLFFIYTGIPVAFFLYNLLLVPRLPFSTTPEPSSHDSDCEASETSPILPKEYDSVPVENEEHQQGHDISQLSIYRQLCSMEFM